MSWFAAWGKSPNKCSIHFISRLTLIAVDLHVSSSIRRRRRLPTALRCRLIHHALTTSLRIKAKFHFSATAKESAKGNLRLTDVRPLFSECASEIRRIFSIVCNIGAFLVAGQLQSAGTLMRMRNGVYNFRFLPMSRRGPSDQRQLTFTA